MFKLISSRFSVALLSFMGMSLLLFAFQDILHAQVFPESLKKRAYKELEEISKSKSDPKAKVSSKKNKQAQPEEKPQKAAVIEDAQAEEKEQAAEERIKAFQESFERSMDDVSKERKRSQKAFKDQIEPRLLRDVQDYLHGNFQRNVGDFFAAETAYAKALPSRVNPWNQVYNDVHNDLLLEIWTGKAYEFRYKSIVQAAFKLDGRRGFKKLRRPLEDAIKKAELGIAKLEEEGEGSDVQERYQERAQNLKQWLEECPEEWEKIANAYQSAYDSPENPEKVFKFIEIALDRTYIPLVIEARQALLFLLEHHTESSLVVSGSVSRKLAYSYYLTYEFEKADEILTKAQTDYPAGGKTFSELQQQIESFRTTFEEAFYDPEKR